MKTPPALFSWLVVFCALLALGGCKNETKPSEGKTAQEDSATEESAEAGASAEDEANKDGRADSALACDDAMASGDFEEALRIANLVLAEKPGDEFFLSKKERVLHQKELKQHYVDANGFLEKGQCVEALEALERITDENSWAARQALSEGLQEKAERCSKPEPIPTTADECFDQAKRLVVSNPARAVELYEKGLAMKDDPIQRCSYAFALERSGETCKALAEYEKAVDKVSGKAQVRAKKGIEKFKESCK